MSPSVMHGGVRSMLFEMMPYLLISTSSCPACVSNLLSGAPQQKCNPCLFLFGLRTAGDRAGAVLRHGVCGPAVVGGLSQQICRHQRTPPLYQEAHFNHRCTWHFVLPLYCSCLSAALKKAATFTGAFLNSLFFFCFF